MLIAYHTLCKMSIYVPKFPVPLDKMSIYVPKFPVPLDIIFTSNYIFQINTKRLDLLSVYALRDACFPALIFYEVF